MDGILNWKKCKKCEVWFDIATNYDICSECRNKLKEGKENGEQKKL